MNHLTVTARALATPVDTAWRDRRDAALKDAIKQCMSAVRTVLQLEPTVLKVPVTFFSFDGQQGHFCQLMYRVEGMTFLFERDQNGRYRDDRMQLIEMHGVHGFWHVLFSLGELGDLLRTLPEKHSARPHIDTLAQRPAAPVLYDRGAWAYETNVWNH